MILTGSPAGELVTQTGTQIFTYQVASNSTGAARTGRIFFQTISGGLAVELEVTQFGDGAFNLTLTTDSQTLPYTANDLSNPTDYNEVGVISNTDWTWETDADWINSDEDLVLRAELINGQDHEDFDGSNPSLQVPHQVLSRGEALMAVMAQGAMAT